MSAQPRQSAADDEAVLAFLKTHSGFESDSIATALGLPRRRVVGRLRSLEHRGLVRGRRRSHGKGSYGDRSVEWYATWADEGTSDENQPNHGGGE